MDRGSERGGRGPRGSRAAILASLRDDERAARYVAPPSLHAGAVWLAVAAPLAALLLLAVRFGN